MIDAGHGRGHGNLGHRQRFTAEQRFIDLQIAGFVQNRVGGNPVTLLEDEQVAVDDLPPGDPYT